MTDQQDLRARLPKLPEPSITVMGAINKNAPMSFYQGYSADQMHAYALEAAPRLPAGVPDGWVLVPKELPESWQEAMCVAHEFSGFHDLMGPMGAAYAKLIELAVTSQPDSQKSDKGGK